MASKSGPTTVPPPPAPLLCLLGPFLSSTLSAFSTSPSATGDPPPSLEFAATVVNHLFCCFRTTQGFDRAVLIPPPSNEQPEGLIFATPKGRHPKSLERER
ncbi:SLIT-ROBO Rho GTPase-activating protein 2 [Striga asiatica]|uniref:SLIT-ROBO Rho GTPase-activating protein 2 n=1 Tax=Striga asiatica TaxID=4170 RepID=A0A5A7PE29_STRAF|nr:SLIT-ROBO Rho GTPase-activating protein 2 [Striga asiatica]